MDDELTDALGGAGGDSRDPSAKSTTQDPLKALRAVTVARRYFLDGRTKTEIAAEFEVSRFQVARLLEWARSEHLVQIRVLDPQGLDSALSERLRSSYRLDNVVVVSLPDMPEEIVRVDLARLAAQYLEARLQPDDVVGLAWGRTIDRLVDFLGEIPPVATVQIAGGMQPVAHAMSGTELVRSFATRAHGSVYPILAPFVVQDPDTAKRLRREDVISSTFDMFSKISIAVVGIGSWHPPTSLLLASLSGEDATQLFDLGAEADICASVFDRNGVEIGAYLSPRAMCISTEQLRAIPEVIAVAGGVGKSQAIEAALRSGVVNTLITDSVVAARLLAGQNPT
jgi:DNA-binding transcriptional regulator LsrR (DeoR family)